MLAVEVRAAVGRARSWIIGERAPSGGWNDSTPVLPSLVARFVLARRFSESFLEDELESSLRVLLSAQLPDGGWADKGNTAELNSSVEAYLAIKIAHRGTLDEPLRRALLRIRELGGLEACTGETRLLLALFNQFPDKGGRGFRLRWNRSDRLPGQAAESSRGALALLRRLNVTVSLRSDETIRELSVGGPRRRDFGGLVETALRWPAAVVRWPRSKFSRRTGDAGVSRRAVRTLLKSLSRKNENRLGTADLLRLAFLLHAVGRSEGPAWQRCWRSLSRLAVEHAANEGFHFRKADSSTRGTAEALRALQEAGLTTAHPVVAREIARIVSRISDCDWLDLESILSVLAALQGQFETNSDALPPIAFVVDGDDVDSSESNRLPDTDELLEQSACLIHERLGRFLQTIRPARWNAPRCGATLEILGKLGLRDDSPHVGRLLRRLACLQAADGSFGDGERGSIETTAQIITGLRAVGIEAENRLIATALQWLRLWQDPRGAWRAAEDISKDRCELKIARTASAVVALLSSEAESDYELIHQGVAFLLETQKPDGSWGNTTDSPSDMAATRAALIALSRYAVRAAELPKPDAKPSFRVVHSEEEEEKTSPKFTIAR